jgi:glycosyltransferase involved in cell wall biosynthesis
MQFLVAMAPGGAERLALTILDRGQDRIDGTVCALQRGSGLLASEIEKMGLPWRVLGNTAPTRLQAWLELAKLLRRERIDVLHVQAGYLLSFALPAAWLAGVRVVYTEHARHSLEHQPWLLRMVRLAEPFLHAMTCVSEDLKSFLVERVGVPSWRIQVIPNGVDLERFVRASTRLSDVPAEVVPMSWRDRRITVFGNVARFSDAKDHVGLLHAFDAVRRVHPASRLLLVGDGETRPVIEATIRELVLEDWVHLTGMRQDVPAMLRCMDIFVLSSQREGMPISVLEAMAAGLPVITTDVGGIREVVADGVTARIVPPRDRDMLCRAMCWMLEQPEARTEMAATGEKLVRTRYEHDVMVGRYMDLYIQTRRRA